MSGIFKPPPVCTALSCYHAANEGGVWCDQHDPMLRRSSPVSLPPHYAAAKEAWETAGKLVQGDRRETHGDFIHNFRAIAAVWNGYLTARQRGSNAPSPLDEQDVAHMMALMKIARTLNGGHNPDDHVDLIGYSMIAAGIAGGAGSE